MFDSLANGLIAVKDRAVEVASKAFLNREIEKFGALTKLEIDSKAKAIRGEVLLKGEISPITINVGRYELARENGAAYISFQNLTASREWVGLALNEYLAGRKLRVPDGVMRVL